MMRRSGGYPDIGHIPVMAVNSLDDAMSCNTDKVYQRVYQPVSAANRLKEYSISYLFSWIYGGPGRSPTCDLRVRSAINWPLQANACQCIVSMITNKNNKIRD